MVKFSSPINHQEKQQALNLYEVNELENNFYNIIELIFYL